MMLIQIIKFTVLAIIVTLSNSQAEPLNLEIAPETFRAAREADRIRQSVGLDGAVIKQTWRQQNDSANPGEFVFVNDDSEYNVRSFISNASVDLMGRIIIPAAVIAFATDKELKNFVLKNDGQIVDRTAKYSEVFGSPKMSTLLAAGYIFGYVIDDSETKTFVKMAFEATLATGIINTALKYATSRCLPSTSDNPYQRCDEKQASKLDFPSSHAASAFSVATVVAKTFGKDSSVIPFLAYGAASLTAYSRVKTNNHWTSAVIVGGLLGHLVADSVLNAKESDSGFRFRPIVGKRYSGFQMSWVPHMNATSGSCNAERSLEGVSRCMRLGFQKM